MHMLLKLTNLTLIFAEHLSLYSSSSSYMVKIYSNCSSKHEFKLYCTRVHEMNKFALIQIKDQKL